MPAKPGFGPCAECGVNNSHSATRCHQCRALLPWAQPKPQAASPEPKASGSPKIKVGADWDFKAIGVQLFGGLLFLVGAGLWIGNVTGMMRTFPGAGYITMLVGGVIWKAGGSV